MLAATGATSVASFPAWGGEPLPGKAELALAVLDFQNTETEDPLLGGKIADLLTIRLARDNRWTVIERQHLQALLKEKKLDLSGLVDGGATAKAGRLIGARLLITGRAYRVAQALWISAKVINAETSQVTSVLTHGEPGTPLDGQLDELADKLAKEFVKQTGLGAAQELSTEALLDALRQRTAGKDLPPLCAWVVYVEPGQAATTHSIRTELHFLLKAAGFKVFGGVPEAVRQWLHAGDPAPLAVHPASDGEVQVALVAWISSEAVGATRDLLSWQGHATLSALDLRTGAVLGTAEGIGKGLAARDVWARLQSMRGAVAEALSKVLPKILKQ